MGAKHLGESISAILICMAVASMLFSACYVYHNSARYNWMVIVLKLMIISAIVRIIERFNYTEVFFDNESSGFGAVIGIEIAITWACLLVSEFYISMKYLLVSNQLPDVIKGQKSFNDISTKSQRAAMTIGIIANIAVSFWPGILYTVTFYRNRHVDLHSVFWEFEIAIWLNALSRLVSLTIFAVSLKRITTCVREAAGMATNSKMVFMNWMLVILSAGV